MGRTIEDSIKYFTSMSRCYLRDYEYLSIAVETMRKYQKIEDIYYHQTGRALEDSLRSVIEDGTNEKTSN